MCGKWFSLCWSAPIGAKERMTLCFFNGTVLLIFETFCSQLKVIYLKYKWIHGANIQLHCRAYTKPSAADIRVFGSVWCGMVCVWYAYMCIQRWFSTWKGFTQRFINNWFHQIYEAIKSDYNINFQLVWPS